MPHFFNRRQSTAAALVLSVGAALGAADASAHGFYPGYGSGYGTRGAISLSLGGSPWHYGAGHWHRRSGPRYYVSPPRVGFVIPVLPSGYTTVMVAGIPYYYANGVYYGAATGGYSVVPSPSLPPIVEVQTQPAPPTAIDAPAPVAPPASTAAATSTAAAATAATSLPQPPLLPPSDWILYPRNGQSAVQTQADRQECNQWASGQNEANLASVYQRALLACLDAKGYTVR